MQLHVQASIFIEHVTLARVQINMSFFLQINEADSPQRSCFLTEGVRR